MVKGSGFAQENTLCITQFPYLRMFYTTMERKALLNIGKQNGKVKIRDIQAD